MSKKVAALTVAFNEEKLIKPCVRQFKYPYLGGDIFHLVLVSEKPWRGSYPPDNTGKVALKTGADHVRLGDWADQATQFNSGLDYLNELGYEWAIIADADEFYTRDGLNTLLGRIEWSEYNALRASDMRVYWKTPEFLIVPDQHDSPIVAIKTDQKFTDKRNADVFFNYIDAPLYHFSYVRSDEEMLKKIESFEHSHEFDKQKWYNEVWLKWDGDKENLHPVVPEQFKRVVRSPAPREIWDNYYAD